MIVDVTVINPHPKSLSLMERDLNTGIFSPLPEGEGPGVRVPANVVDLPEQLLLVRLEVRELEIGAGDDFQHRPGETRGSSSEPFPPRVIGRAPPVRPP